MAVVETISNTYTLDNANVYERYLNGNLLGIRIVPNEKYVLCRAEEIDGEMTYYYTVGFIAIARVQIPTVFPQISAILLTDVPEGSFVNGLPDQTETE